MAITGPETIRRARLGAFTAGALHEAMLARPVTETQPENPATTDAFNDFGVDRRQGLWTAAPAAASPEAIPGTTDAVPP